MTRLSFFVITPWSRVLLEKLIVAQPVKKFSAFYRIRSFISVFTRACHLSLCCFRWVRSTTSQPVPLRSIILPYVQAFQLISSFQILLLKFYIQFLTAPYVLHPLPIAFFFIWSPNYIGEEYKLWSSSLSTFFHTPVT
jgi:hypothetical protein